MNYCTKEQIKNEFPGWDSEKDARLDDAVEDASRIIDLNVAGVDGDNYFAPPGIEPTILEIEGLGIDSLPVPRHVRNSITMVTSHELPLQYLWKLKKNEIVFVNEYGDTLHNLRFPEGRTFEVTGRWGWDAVPKQIQRATIDMAVELLRDGTSVWSGVVGGIKIAANLIYKKPLPFNVQKTTDTYKAQYEAEQGVFVL